MKFHVRPIKLIILSLFMTLLLMACSPTGSGGNFEPEVESVPDLNGTSWLLEQFGPEGEATAVLPDTTITLNFTDEGVNGTAGCNSYFGDMTQAGSALSFGALGSTRMACPEPIMQQENDYLAALGTVSTFSLADGQLTLQYEEGTLVFTAGTPEEANEAADSDTETVAVKTLFVGPELVDCVGEAPQQCLQVRENEADEWTLFYDQINGFEFEPGYAYELRVTETEVENPPADASSLEVTLVEVVSKTAVATTPEPRPEGSTLEGPTWMLVSFGPNDNQTAVLPNTELTLNFDGAQINGDAGCNSYFADATINDDGSLEFGPMGSTLMACMDEAVMQQESDFLAALSEATSYTLSGNRLTLHTPDGSLEFVPASMPETTNEETEIVDWETAVSLLNSGEVIEIFQTHSLDVTLTLVDGRLVKTVEPAIDDIFTAIEACGEPCSDILMATE
ncbi:MAG: META domain-containing protein [Ardenticatenaceae bacterium]|nr:META domain-containing protein [Ardenticatenaceae bacterium]